EEKIHKGLTPEQVSALLSERYAGDAETILRALAETVEQVNSGFAVPTPRRIVVEDWGEFVIIHSNFGSLINRALAQFLGEVLSDKLGRGIVVQHDPYRIFVQTMGNMSAERLVEVFNELKGMGSQAVKDTL